MLRLVQFSNFNNKWTIEDVSNFQTLQVVGDKPIVVLPYHYARFTNTGVAFIAVYYYAVEICQWQCHCLLPNFNILVYFHDQMTSICHNPFFWLQNHSFFYFYCFNDSLLTMDCSWGVTSPWARGFKPATDVFGPYLSTNQMEHWQSMRCIRISKRSSAPWD